MMDILHRTTGEGGGREGAGDAYAVCCEVVSEIYLHCETGEVQGNSGIIKLCT